MEHNDSKVRERFHHKQCVHGMCHNHGPEWKNIGERQLKPNPGIFGQTTYWNSLCCGARMWRGKLIQTQRCKKCGRKRIFIRQSAVAVCLCCDRTLGKTPICT